MRAPTRFLVRDLGTIMPAPAPSAEPVLVTGCAGFIAARTSELLLDAGRRVIGIDSLNDAYDPALKRWRIDRLRARAGFEFNEFDILQSDRLGTLLRAEAARGAPVRTIYHLAARAGVRASIEHPDVYYEANVLGTLEVLNAARAHDVQRLVMASTSSVYGNSPVPFREEAPADRPLSPYAASKRGAEMLAHAYHHLYGLHVTVPRFFTVYGPAGRPDMSIFRLARCLLTGETFQLHGDGMQSRDFTYIDDIAGGTIACGGLTGYHVVNLGNNHPLRLAEIIHILERLGGQKVRITRTEANPADVNATWADIRRARELLGWNPQVTPEEGLRRTLEWHRTNQSWLDGLRVEAR